MNRGLRAGCVIGTALLLAGGAALLWALLPGRPPEPPRSGSLRQGSITVDGRQRSFIYYVPASPGPGMPLLMVLHGASMNGDAMRAATGYDFERLADQKRFIVVYPDAFERQWNDCRTKGDFAARRLGVDDVAFLRMLIVWFEQEQAIDRKNVFLAGLSNGGHLSYRVAFEAPDLVQGIAAIAASLPAATNQSCTPSGVALPVMIINGTDDPLNPFRGGNVGLFGLLFRRGVVVSTSESARYWATLAGHDPAAVQQELRDTDARDGTRARRQVWSGEGRPDVELIIVEGGGHTAPHPVARFPRVFGRTSREFSAAGEIWKFFERELNRDSLLRGTTVRGGTSD